ncbi:polysaccharide pyruvyl transferase family protein [Microbacterium sp. NPDC057407]|uniref:polysaccharide pyruvyl transferase family protein n=1 Tax=Microbacterium sp. NPDC057407 TaxID=3346120 RepID=UPI003670EB43
MRVLVGWAGDSSPNLGVRALGRGSADLLRAALPDARIEFMDFGARPAALPWGRPRSLVRERLTGRAGMMEWLGQFDLYWDTRSGDSFADIYGIQRHAKMSLVHEFAAQAGAVTALAPQTIGPFRTRRGRLLAQRNLRRSALVFARDPASARAAQGLGRPADRTTTDLVFGISQPEPTGDHDVLLNVSGLLWKASDHVDHGSYRAAVRTIISRLLSDGRRVTLLPHVLDSHDPDNDVPVSRALQDEYDGRLGLHVPADLDDARSAIAAAQLVIGARMHACLNALSTGTPAVAMAYSRKFQPLMAELGWSHVISLAESTDAAADVLREVAAPGLSERALDARARGQELLSPVGELVRSVM